MYFLDGCGENVTQLLSPDISSPVEVPCQSSAPATGANALLGPRRSHQTRDGGAAPLAEALQNHFSEIAESKPELLGRHFGEAGLTATSHPLSANRQRAGRKRRPMWRPSRDEQSCVIVRHRLHRVILVRAVRPRHGRILGRGWIKASSRKLGRRCKSASTRLVVGCDVDEIRCWFIQPG